MRHVFKSVIKFSQAIARLGRGKALEDLDENSKRELRLHGIYNNQHGPGRRSFFRMHIRWRSIWEGNGKYLRPEYRERARRRAKRYFRHRPFLISAPGHIMEKSRL